MIKSRNMVGAFLQYQDQVLLLRRDAGRMLEPLKWTGVGGHIEANELNNPLAACLREIQEETGIPPASIQDLRLRYITINRTNQEIRIAFYFFGHLTGPQKITDTREGVLQWVPKGAMFSRDLSSAVRHILEHWVQSADRDSVYVVTINRETQQVQIAPI